MEGGWGIFYCANIFHIFLAELSYKHFALVVSGLKPILANCTKVSLLDVFGLGGSAVQDIAALPKEKDDDDDDDDDSDAFCLLVFTKQTS